MGGNVRWEGDSLKVSGTRTRGAVVDASQCPDIVPILAVLAAVSEGTTRIVNAGRLRIKESDRLKAMATELNKLGARVTEEPEGLAIEGVRRLAGGVVDGWERSTASS
jgi:3-phosphoshikimate 1-carboxyvinyltransferase